MPPLGTVNLGGRRIVLDANLTVFSVLVAILVVAALLML